MPQPTPPLVQQAFAKNAAPGFITTIPVTTADPERADYNLGFKPLSMTEILAGGKPPYGQDMNGILFAVSSHIAALQAGQPYLYNSTLATAMVGYAVGSVLGMADGTGLWINTVAANTTDPDGVSAAGWMPLFSRGFAQPAVPSAGVFVVAASDYRKGTIVLAGSLAGNLQVVLPSGVIGQRSWLIVNALTGSFTTTVKTAAGSGVVVPAGGFAAPTGVYGDGTNIYPTVAPVNLPIDQNPTPNTIAQRTNNGYLFATYFNQNSPLENFSINGIIAEAGDGYFRKIAPSNLAVQINIQWLAGVIANAQVPQSAVTQHSAAVLANAALTGTPTAPTAGAGTNNGQVANTAYAFAQDGGNAAWADVTGSRALGTPFTNSTGRVLDVSVTLSLNNNSNGSAVVGGVNVGTVSSPDRSFAQTLTFRVPPGATYQVSIGGGSVSSFAWREML